MKQILIRIAIEYFFEWLRKQEEVHIYGDINEENLDKLAAKATETIAGKFLDKLFKEAR